MNPVQRIVGAIGVVCIILVGLFPVWEVVGKVRYDFEATYNDSGKTMYHSTEQSFRKQKRDFLFFDMDRRPEAPYEPSETKGFDDKKGYYTVECVNSDIVDYGYRLNVRQTLMEILIVLVPTLLLILVFSGSKHRD